MLHLEDKGVIFLLLPGRGAHHGRETLGDLQTSPKRPSERRGTEWGFSHPGWGHRSESPELSPGCSQSSLPHCSPGDNVAEALRAHHSAWAQRGRDEGRAGDANPAAPPLLPILTQPLILRVHRQAQGSPAPPSADPWGVASRSPSGSSAPAFGAPCEDGSLRPLLSSTHRAELRSTKAPGRFWGSHPASLLRCRLPALWLSMCI